MLNCPKCKKNMIGEKRVREKENKWDIVRGAGFICGGPVAMTIIAAGEGIRLYDKFVRDEVQVKCPHCGEVITLTKAQYKELKKGIKEVQKDKRHATQNRIK